MNGEGASAGREWNWTAIRLVIACHLGLAASLSPAFLSVFGLFLKPMAAGTGWTRANISLAFSIVSIIETPLLPVVGWAVDKWGAKSIVLFALVALPASIALLAAGPPSHFGYVAAAVVLGCVAATASPCAYLSLLSRRFDRSLGLAIALSVSGMGLGQLINAFVIDHLLGAVGWRQTWYYLALIVAFIGLLAFLIVPWRQLAALRAAPPAKTERAPRAEGRGYLRHGPFWLLTIAFTLVLFVNAGVVVNVAASLSDRGFGYLASSAIAAMGVASAISRFVGGALLDRIPAHWFGATLFVLQGVGAFLLAFVSVPAALLFAVFAISFAYGAETDIMPFFIRKLYSPDHFGRIFGFMFGFAHLGLIFGPIAGAWSFAAWSSYKFSFVLMGLLSLVAALLLVIAVRMTNREAALTS